MSQSIPVYLHQIMHDLSDSGDLPQQKSVYPKVDADPEIGTIRYVLIHKALMPESKISTRGAMSLQAKYAIRHVAGSPIKWFGLAPFNPLVEVQPLFISTRRPPRLKRVALRSRTPRVNEIVTVSKPEERPAAKPTAKNGGSGSTKAASAARDGSKTKPAGSAQKAAAAKDGAAKPAAADAKGGAKVDATKNDAVKVDDSAKLAKQ